jgi:hypothetical protein
MTPRVRVFLGWLLAVLIAAVGGTLVQVQSNAAALGALGPSVPLADRATMLIHDLVHFAPTYAALIAAGFIVAWPVAGGLARWRPRWRAVLFPLAGFAALATILVAMKWALPITAIAAARTPLGATLLCLAGAVAGLAYVFLTRPQESASA